MKHHERPMNMDITIFELQFRQISVVYNDGDKIVKIGERPYGNLTILLYRRGSKKLHLEQTLELSPAQFRGLQSFIAPEKLQSADVNYYDEIYDTLRIPTFTNYGAIDNGTYLQLQPLDDTNTSRENIPPRKPPTKRHSSKQI